MPLMLTAPLFTETTRLKASRLFHYASPTADLANGMVVQVDFSVSTYGVGKACKIGTTTAAASFIGPVDAAIDASADGLGGGFSDLYRTIPIVVYGVKEEVRTDNSATEGTLQMASAGTGGTSTDVTAGSEHFGFMVALEDDAQIGATGTYQADMFVKSLWTM